MERILSMIRWMTFGIIVNAINNCNAIGGDVYVHDPSFIKSGPCYYVVSSGGWFKTGGAAPMRKICNGTASLVKGDYIPIPHWTAAATKRAHVANLWAPDINYFNNQYYIFYAASDAGSRDSAIGVATAAHVEGPYTDQGEVVHTVGTDQFNAIDPEIAWTFVNGQKTDLWLIFGSYWEGIKMRRLDTKTAKLTPIDFKTYSLASRGGQAIEGASSCYRDGWYYLFVSFDHCCQGAKSNYRVMVGRSRQITGPYVDRNGVDMMKGGGTQILASHDHVRGPGGEDVYNDNGVYRMIYHWYDANEEGHQKMNIVDLVWDKDHWPSVGPDSKLN